MSVVWQQRTHGVLKRHEQTNRMFARLFLVAVLVVSLLAAAYLALVASNVHVSRQVWAIQHDIVATQRESQALRVEIARLSSIPVLQERSVALQYQPATDIDYIFLGDP